MPPSPFYTNAVEYINSLLRLCTDYKKQEFTTFVIKLKELVETQFSEVDRAIAGVGEYEVAKEYPNFQYSAARWCAMSKEQRKRVLNQFQSSDPVAFPADSSSQADISSLSHSDSTSSNPSLSNPLTGLGIPDYVADLMLTEANALFKEDSDFVNAPENASQAWMVARSSGSTGRLRFLCIYQGRYECEADCTYFQTCKVCAHVNRLIPIFGNSRTSLIGKIIATFRPLGLLQASLQNYNVTTELDRCGMITNQGPSVMVRSNQSKFGQRETPSPN